MSHTLVVITISVVEVYTSVVVDGGVVEVYTSVVVDGGAVEVYTSVVVDEEADGDVSAVGLAMLLDGISGVGDVTSRGDVVYDAIFCNVLVDGTS